MKITNHNKDLIQSYVMTTAKYDFSATEKRVLYRIVEVLQARTKDLKLRYDYSTQEDLFGNTEFTLPISCFLKNDDDKNYNQVKKALWDLRQKSFEYEDDKEWGVYGIIEMPKIAKYKSFVKFTITPLLLGAFLNFSKGYRKYELETAMQFESVYTMRFYELFSNKTKPITYSIDELKKMFKIENKYKLVADLIRRVIEPAKKELDKSSPYSFVYEKVKTGRKVTSIKFKPYYIPKNRDEDLESKEIQKQTSIRWDLSKEVVLMLKDKFDLTDKGIKNNRALLASAVKRSDFLDICNEINGMIRKYEVKSKPAYFISQLKKAVNKEL